MWLMPIIVYNVSAMSYIVLGTKIFIQLCEFVISLGLSKGKVIAIKKIQKSFLKDSFAWKLKDKICRFVKFSKLLNGQTKGNCSDKV